ncbi:MAG: FAD-dependent thymidylate synthase [bacterium]|nr:MAG: FAD-dependent thymidylate synthase [bacterium]
MKVTLAGYNIEAEGIERLNRETGETYTPEVISAAYARVTRDPRRLETFRREARKAVDTARDRNERIVYKFGHRSIAEHAVFNFDIMGISRLAVEEVEHFRLASYTEKSQRYIRLGKDIIVPREISERDLDSEFSAIMVRLHHAYEELLEVMLAAGEKEGVAKEDARYLMPLATAAQLGMTVNARELEYMIARLASHPLDEMRRLSGQLCEAAAGIAPSLVKYPDTTPYFENMHPAREEFMHSYTDKGTDKGGGSGDVARLVEVTDGGDRRLASCLLFSVGGMSMEEAERLVRRMPRKDLQRIVARTLRHIEKHDSVWREFESVNLLFEVVVSASCFAQLKRHRLATLITQPYDLSLGIKIPESIRKAKAVRLFRTAVRSSEKLFSSLKMPVGPAAAYALSNAHRRRALVGINLRELYHFSRLRSDRHAQWEIRNLSNIMCGLAAERLPVSTMLLGGKDGFDEQKNTILSGT